MGEWKTGIFDCFKDVPICLQGWCCGCLLFGSNAEQISGAGKMGACCKYCFIQPCFLCFLVHKPQRIALRAAYNLPEDPSDFVSTCILSGCANCQEAREMKLRGVQPGGRIPVSSQPR